MSKNIKTFLTAICCAVIACLLYNYYYEIKSRPLKASFRVMDLLADPGIVEPTNTETTTQYNFLENVSVGLLRDSMSHPSGYEGMLASSWTRVSPKTWKFYIRPNLRWSDGTELTPDYIAKSLSERSYKPSRHTICLLHLKTARVTNENEITLEFKRPIGDTLLHELSLADHTIWHPDSRKNLWRVTSGPYSLEAIHSEHNQMVLVRNPHFVTPRANGPNRVILIGPIPNAEAPVVFSQKQYDVILASTGLDNSKVQRIKYDAPQIFVGMPSVIQFLVPVFSTDISLKEKKQITDRIRLLLSKELKVEKKFFLLEDQMAPPGFNGRVQNLSSPSTSVLSGRKFDLQIDLTDASESLAPALETVFKSIKHEFKSLKFSVDEKNLAKKSIKLAVRNFKANQRDSLGSWAFLSSQNGALSSYASKIRPFIDQAIGEDFEDRQNTLATLHQKVLENGWLIPAVIGNSEAYHSNRVSLDRWSRFDMRPRYYDIEML